MKFLQNTCRVCDNLSKSMNQGIALPRDPFLLPLPLFFVGLPFLLCRYFQAGTVPGILTVTVTVTYTQTL